MMHIRKVWNGLLYGFYVIVHPFKGFWDLKHEKKGNFGAAGILLILLIITFTAKRQLTGFLFNTNNLADLNIILMITSVIVPFSLWCVSNWCITTLVDGEGKISDIALVTAYSLIPMIIIQLPMVILSNYITIGESGIYTFFMTLSIIWTAFLLIIGIMTVHQFTMLKTIVTILIAIIGMIIMLFLFFMLFALLQQMANFIILIYKELEMR